MSAPRVVMQRAGVALIAALSGWFVIGRPFMAQRRAALERIAAERRGLAEDLALLGGERNGAAEEAELQARVDRVQRWTIGVGGAGAAGAAAVGHFEREATGRHVTLQRIEPLAATALDGGALAVPVRVQGESDFQGLLEFLAALEAGTPLVVVDGLRLQGGGLIGGVAPVTFEFVATVFAWPAEPGGAEAGRGGS